MKIIFLLLVLFCASLFLNGQVTNNMVYKENNNLTTNHLDEKNYMQVVYATSSSTASAIGVQAVVIPPDRKHPISDFVGTSQCSDSNCGTLKSKKVIQN